MNKDEFLLIGHLYMLIYYILVQILCLFKKHVVLIFGIDLLEFYVPDKSSLSDICIMNIFS